MLYICKWYMVLSTFENIWLWKLVLWQCSHVVFPYYFALVEEVLLAMV
jgi:hypothetical protein